MLIFLCLSVRELYTQHDKNTFVEITTWSLTQFVPSPTFYQDNNSENSRLQFGLKWSVTPVNYSFNANKMVSPFQFFKVNPMRRYGGSVELFVQPEWATSGFRYAGISRFMLSPGVKLYVPFIEYGEYLAGSVGMKYTIRKNGADNYENVSGLELGLYSFFGIAGINFTYNFTKLSSYNFSFNLKYY